jgi:hypothetical protein
MQVKVMESNSPSVIVPGSGNLPVLESVERCADDRVVLGESPDELRTETPYIGIGSEGLDGRRISSKPRRDRRGRCRQQDCAKKREEYAKAQDCSFSGGVRTLVLARADRNRLCDATSIIDYGEHFKPRAKKAPSRWPALACPRRGPRRARDRPARAQSTRDCARPNGHPAGASRVRAPARR